MGPGEPLPAFFADVLIAQTLVKQLGFASGIQFPGLGMGPFLAPLGILPPLTATSPNSQKLIAIEWGAVMIEVSKVFRRLAGLFRRHECFGFDSPLEEGLQQLRTLETPGPVDLLAALPEIGTSHPVEHSLEGL